MFDYILTGPIPGVSAGQYIVGLVAQTLTYFGHPWEPSAETTNLAAAGLAALITLYFWRRNTRRYTRVLRRRAAHHVRDDRHGRAADTLVGLHHPDATRQPEAPARARDPEGAEQDFYLGAHA